MSNKNKQYYIPTRNANTPNHTTLYPLEKKDYDLFCKDSREINRERKRNQRRDQCNCPTEKLWSCDLDCCCCKYRAFGNTVSLDDDLVDVEGITRAAAIASPTLSPEEVYMKALENETLKKAVYALSDEDKRICIMILLGKSERDTADAMGIPQTTLNYRKKKLLAHLREELSDWI